MAIESNNSEEVVAGGGYQLYTGIVPVSVVAVNPTQDRRLIFIVMSGMEF